MYISIYIYDLLKKKKISLCYFWEDEVDIDHLRQGIATISKSFCDSSSN